jgi:hypothetical protein
MAKIEKNRAQDSDAAWSLHAPLVAVEYDVEHGVTVSAGLFKTVEAFEQHMDERAEQRGLSRRMLTLFDGDVERVKFLAISGGSKNPQGVGVFYINPDTKEVSVVAYHQTSADFLGDLEYLHSLGLEKEAGGAPDINAENYLIVPFKLKHHGS